MIWPSVVDKLTIVNYLTKWRILVGHIKNWVDSTIGPRYVLFHVLYNNKTRYKSEDMNISIKLSKKGTASIINLNLSEFY